MENEDASRPDESSESDAEYQLFLAIRQNDVREVKHLLNEGVSITKVAPNGLTPLDAACRAPVKLKILQLMLTSYDLSQVCLHGYPPSFADSYPLFIASKCYTFSPTFIERWVSFGLSLNMSDPSGDTPLHYAVRSRRNFLLHWGLASLLKYGADPQARNNDGLTPLHLVASTHEVPNSTLYREITKLLRRFTRAGADVNAQDVQGRTPLHVARMRIRFNCVADLLFLGADVNVEDYSGLTVLDHIYNTLEQSDCITMVGEREPLEVERRLYESTRILLYHVIKMNTVGLHVSENVQSGVQKLHDWVDFMHAGEVFSEKYTHDGFSKESIRDFTEECRVEKKKLQDTKLDEHTSLYEILHMRKNDEALTLMEQKVFADYFGSKKCREDFPNYWYFLTVNSRSDPANHVLNLAFSE